VNGGWLLCLCHRRVLEPLRFSVLVCYNASVSSIITRVALRQFELFWKADTRPLHQTIDSIRAQGAGAVASAADVWFLCALAERDPAAAERALVALGDNPWWGESGIRLGRNFGEGLLARMTNDEARARAAFATARAEQEKIVQAQPDFRADSVRPRLDRRRVGAQRGSLGGRTARHRTSSRGKGCHQWQSHLSIFRDHGGMGGRQGVSFAAAGNWTACSRRFTRAELRRPKTDALLGPAPRRSALRENRSVASAQTIERKLSDKFCIQKNGGGFRIPRASCGVFKRRRRAVF
jgi:hypothetical protein